MSLAELAKRHREKGGNRDSASRLTLGDTKKKESKGSGALSLSDLLNKKKNNSTDQPKKPILSNLKNLVTAKAVPTESTKDQSQSQVRSILKIEEKVEKLSIQDKTTSRWGPIFSIATVVTVVFLFKVKTCCSIISTVIGPGLAKRGIPKKNQGSEPTTNTGLQISSLPV